MGVYVVFYLEMSKLIRTFVKKITYTPCYKYVLFLFYLIKKEIMIEALKVILLFKKPDWDDFRLPYIFIGVIGWLEIIAIVIGLIK